MSGKTSRQIRKEVKGAAEDMKSVLALQILNYMEQRAVSIGFFKRLKLAFRYLFFKDFHSIIEA